MPVIAKAGRYELLEELGHGAMGVVYKANDPVIGRTVAVKTIRLAAGGTDTQREELIARFRTEARAAGALTHPNIVAVYDAGEQDGLVYIIMEFVEGKSLQAELDTGRAILLTRGIHLVEQVCAALDYAHQRRIVHRDIKPANLMLMSDDTVKVTDFGTAKMLELGTLEQSQIIGTPSYMSPEQVKGQPVDGRSDLFSVGVVLYELVTGKKPFPGENITTVIYKIVNEEPVSPRKLDPSVHPGLSNVIMRALTKEPAARFQSCKEFLDALKNFKTYAAGVGATIVLDRRLPAEPTVVMTQSVSQVSAPPKKRSAVGNFFFTLFLLAIIGVAGHKVWPVIHEVWQEVRTRPPIIRRPSAPSAAAPSTPKPEEANPGVTLAAPLPVTSSKAGPSAPPKSPPPATKPAAPKPSKKAEEKPKIDPQLIELKGRIEEDLDRSNLTDKVQVSIDGNKLVLTGRLGPMAHQRLMRRVQEFPGEIKIDDKIEYAQEAPGALEEDPELNGKCLLVVNSNPPGAQVYVDGKPTGLVTPARIRVEPGPHGVRLDLPGHESVRRLVEAQANKIIRLNPKVD